MLKFLEGWCELILIQNVNRTCQDNNICIFILFFNNINLFTVLIVITIVVVIIVVQKFLLQKFPSGFFGSSPQSTAVNTAEDLCLNTLSAYTALALADLPNAFGSQKNGLLSIQRWRLPWSRATNCVWFFDMKFTILLLKVVRNFFLCLCHTVNTFTKQSWVNNRLIVTIPSCP